MIPIRSEDSLSPETNPLGDKQCGRVLLGSQDLKPANVKIRHAPTCEQAQCFRCDPSATSLRYDAASELAHLMVTHHDHDLAQVGITGVVGDRQVE